MSKITFGEIDWNSAEVGGSAKPMGKDLFMRTKEGKNVIRVMGNLIQFYVHWVDLPTGGKKKFVCPIESPALVSRLEDSGFKRQRKWLIKVLDRSDDSFKVMEVGTQVYRGVKALADDPNWGKVSGFDITITRGPKGSNPLYAVTPNPHKALDGKYRDMFSEFNANLDIERLIKPADPSDVCEAMGWDASPYTTSQTENSAQDEDFDFDFE